MTTALDKILRLTGATALAEEDAAAELVLAADAALEEARLLLAASDDDDDDGGGGDSGGDSGKDEDEPDDDDVTSDPLYKKMVKRGMKPKVAAKMVAMKNKKQAAATMVDAAAIALAGLSTPYVSQSWVERTATGGLLALASDNGDGKKPYGDVTYADPGYQEDGKKRYPLDSETHCRAAWSYINQSKNASAYSSSQLASIKSKIKSALKKYGADISEDKEPAGKS